MEVLQSRLSRCRSLFVFRVSNGDGEHTGFLFAKTKKQSKGHLPYDAFCHGNGEFYSGIFQRAGCLVHRSDCWLVSGACDEHESGGTFKDEHSGRVAGASICLSKYASVFHDPDWTVFGRGHGRSRFGAIYGGADGKCVPDSVIWSRKRLRRGADDVCICRFGKFFLCHCREISSEICKGRNELKKE